MSKITALQWLASELALGKTNIDLADYYAMHTAEIEIGFDEDETIADLTRVKPE